MNVGPNRRRAVTSHGAAEPEDRSRTRDLAPINVEVAAAPLCEHAARQRELKVRLIALVSGIFGAPALTIVGLATGSNRSDWVAGFGSSADGRQTDPTPRELAPHEKTPFPWQASAAARHGVSKSSSTGFLARLLSVRRRCVPRERFGASRL